METRKIDGRKTDKHREEVSRRQREWWRKKKKQKELKNQEFFPSYRLYE